MSELVAVIGAVGGAGASCVAAGVAAHLGRTTPGGAVLVDLDLCGGGIEVLLGIEQVPGARWPDLSGARGEVEGQAVVASLPRWGDTPVLSASRLAADPLRDDVILDVCSCLLRAEQQVVLDLPRPGAWTPAIRALLSDADATIAVSPCEITAAAGLQALTACLREVRQAGDKVRLVARTPSVGRVDPEDLGALSGLQWVELRDEKGMRGAIERGEGPPLGARSRLARLGDALAVTFHWDLDQP
ncbi:MAG: pilus assembly protein FlpE [Promicromonosporaceae bacterium]|nr:pilus assembly protein FlpE [Promicromonosporaceae bacterium]